VRGYGLWGQYFLARSHVLEHYLSLSVFAAERHGAAARVRFLGVDAGEVLAQAEESVHLG